jgi:hypothetical protein
MPRIRPSSPPFRTGAISSCGRTAPARSPRSQVLRHDAEVFPAYEELIERISQLVEGLLLTTPPQFPPRGAGDFLDYLKLAAKLRGLRRAIWRRW